MTFCPGGFYAAARLLGTAADWHPGEDQGGLAAGDFPRSGLGFKYRLQLDNTVGIVDSDYYGADNEGHIQIQMTNCNPDKPLSVKAGEGFAQGIFLPFGLAEGDAADGMRHGGFGSTTPRE